jgi:hypothetical protein
VSRPTQKDAAEQFERNVTDHVMTVLHDDGLYRHLRFRKPGTGFYGFDLITWPGSLVVHGDTGSYTFSRITDMFEFFHRASGWNHGSINPHYWAEKTPDCGRSVRTYSEDVLRAGLEAHLTEWAKIYPDLLTEYQEAKARYDALSYVQRYADKSLSPVEPKSPDEIRKLIDEYDVDSELNYEDGARRLLSELEAANVVSDTWEWNLSDWDYPYLWCCNAIQWGIDVYAQTKAASWRRRLTTGAGLAVALVLSTLILAGVVALGWWLL